MTVISTVIGGPGQPERMHFRAGLPAIFWDLCPFSSGSPRRERGEEKCRWPASSLTRHPGSGARSAGLTVACRPGAA